MFSTAIHPILVNIQKENPKIRVLAYLDDVFLLGPPIEVLFALENFRADFITIQLEIADHKCEIYSPTPLSSQVSSQTTIPIIYSGSTILGIPIGIIQFIQECCVETAKSGDNLLQAAD